MHFFTLGSSKMEVSATSFFDIVTTDNDHPSYVQPLLGGIYVFFHPFWVVIAKGRFPARWTCQRH